MNNTIKVFVKEPGKPLYEKIIPNTMEALSKIIGGPVSEIKTGMDWKTYSYYHVPTAANRQKYNFYLFGAYYYGTVVFTGDGGRTRRTSMPYDMADFLGLTNNLNGGNK